MNVLHSLFVTFFGDIKYLGYNNSTWFGHVMRKDDEALVWPTLEFAIERVNEVQGDRYWSMSSSWEGLWPLVGWG